MKIRIDRLLANLGYGTRKDVSFLIKNGDVALNGEPLLNTSEIINTEKADITIEGEKLDPLPPFTILLHKPVGYSSSHEEFGQIIFDLLPERFKNRKPILSIAGRLDKDSSGAVLLTDDGQLLHKIIAPKNHVAKYYEVELADDLSGRETEIFMSGTFCLKDDPKPLKPALWQAKTNKTGIMVLQEGRYHQIRRMFGAIGNRVLKLHRFQIGNLTLGDLKPAEYKICESVDIELLFHKKGEQQ